MSALGAGAAAGCGDAGAPAAGAAPGAAGFCVAAAGFSGAGGAATSFGGGAVCGFAWLVAQPAITKSTKPGISSFSVRTNDLPQGLSTSQRR